eukprot:8508603-Pyramimonas_sp.AAC.1
MSEGFQSTHRSIAFLGTQLNPRVDSVEKDVQQAMTDIDAIIKKVEDQRLHIIQLQQAPAGGAPRAGTSTT